MHLPAEYFVSGQCSEKTDVYAFGVFLLELVSGKDVFELTVGPEAEDMLLRDWVSLEERAGMDLRRSTSCRGRQEEGQHSPLPTLFHSRFHTAPPLRFFIFLFLSHFPLPSPLLSSPSAGCQPAARQQSSGAGRPGPLQAGL